MNAYEQRQEEKRERLTNAADKARSRSKSHFQSSDNITDGIPMGQPILIGHHSEKRHRRDLARSNSHMSKGIEEGKKADHYAGLAASVGTGGVSADDPEAVTKLKEQLATKEQVQAKMKAANKALKAGDDAALQALGFKQKAIDLLKEPDFAGRKGFAPYQLTNNGANIRRLKKRIEELTSAADRQTGDDITGDGWTLHENTELNRVQFLFDGKPSAAVRQILKGEAFKWAPSQMAWQRQLNNAGLYAAKCVREKLEAGKGEQ